MSEEIYTEDRQVRVDGSVIWGIRALETSGLAVGDNVHVMTKRGSGRIIIERVARGGSEE